MKRFVNEALILVICLATTACRSENAHGVLVGRFDEKSAILRAKINLPSSGEPYQLRYELRQGPLSCLLTATLRDKDLPIPGDCAGRKGAGTISCNDGRQLPLNWLLTSCKGGYGQSPDPGIPEFSFGFGLDPDRALDQLEKADNAG